LLDRLSLAASRNWAYAKEFAAELIAPPLRLGVTGLARSGKTVFITALVHNLLRGGRLPFFEAAAQDRITRVYLEPQPDDAVPRFDYEGNLAKMTGQEPIWPESTRQISELRLTIEFEAESSIRRSFGPSFLQIDIVDYPGEWLLDLALLNLDFEQWSREAAALARQAPRSSVSGEWLSFVAGLDPQADQSEEIALKGARLFTEYLARCREEQLSLSSLPPGRFLMPGDLAGSPAVTFFPLDLPADFAIRAGSLAAMMKRRFNAYKTHVVEPFFRNHFARLDRQIVLADVLSALNAGPAAVADLQRALTSILECFRPGRANWFPWLTGHRIDRIVFAATKADHLHHESHARLEAILALTVERAKARAEFSGADVQSFAIASVRATWEAKVKQSGSDIPCIIGTPLPGERLGSRIFNGAEELAIFPGDLPADPRAALRPDFESAAKTPAHFVRFRPPPAPAPEFGRAAPLPHIHLDRVLGFLLGDRLR
jgi:predicted YcjX-like family ATPase